MADQLKSIDKATQGIEELEQSVLRAIAEGGSGWFGTRIKVNAGVVTTVQVSSDRELHGQRQKNR